MTHAQTPAPQVRKLCGYLRGESDPLQLIGRFTFVTNVGEVIPVEYKAPNPNDRQETELTRKVTQLAGQSVCLRGVVRDLGAEDAPDPMGLWLGEAGQLWADTAVPTRTRFLSAADLAIERQQLVTTRWTQSGNPNDPVVGTTVALFVRLHIPHPEKLGRIADVGFAALDDHGAALIDTRPGFSYFAHPDGYPYGFYFGNPWERLTFQSQYDLMGAELHPENLNNQNADWWLPPIVLSQSPVQGGTAQFENRGYFFVRTLDGTRHLLRNGDQPYRLNQAFGQTLPNPTIKGAPVSLRRNYPQERLQHLSDWK